MGPNPGKIAAVLNEVTTRFVAVAADLKRRKLTIITETLGEQVQYAEEQLRDAETRLEGYRVSTITLPTENVPVAAGLQSTQPTVLTNYFNQKIQVEEMRRDRLALQGVVARIGTPGFSMDAFQTIPAVRDAPDLNRALEELSSADAELRALKFRYTDEHKPVRDLQDRINTLRTQTIPAMANGLVAQMLTQEQVLDGQIATQSRDLQQIPTRTINEQRLTREQQAAATLYTTLSTRYEEAKLALASAIPDVKVLDPAVAPRRPSSNSAPRIIMLGFMASLGLALAMAILLDQLDKRFRYTEQVTRELGLTILGAVPAIKRGKNGVEKPEDATQTLEAFRSIRLNLAHSYGSGPVRLTITSPGPSEGKSLISSHLARSFAEAGYKTLLIDGDIRRGELHRAFAMRPAAGAARLPRRQRFGGRDSSAHGIQRLDGHTLRHSPASRPGDARLRQDERTDGAVEDGVQCDPGGQPAARRGHRSVRAGCGHRSHGAGPAGRRDRPCHGGGEAQAGGPASDPTPRRRAERRGHQGVGVQVLQLRIRVRGRG